MNNKWINPFLFVVMTALFFACGAKKEDDHGHSREAAADEKEWKQMDDFHMVMAETFHPYKDSANLEPVKARANELAASAEEWSAAALPARVDNEEMKNKIEQLKTETSSLTTAVASGDDNAIGEQLTKVHDLFHEIQEVWYGGGKHEHH